ncbi:hypothetical protein BGZ46_010668 [Entomortierella lignicola]|nr:hypothetical protein BGZ46_010668 [Entomortierella lignicola]
MQKDQEPTHKAKDEWKNVGPPPARTYVNTNNSKVTSTNEIKDKDKLKNNTKDISAATPNQYAPASQSPSTYSPTTALPQPTTVSTTTMPLMSIPKPLGSPPVPQSSTTIHQSLAKQAVSSPVAIQSSVTSAAGSPVAPPPSTNQKSLAGSPVAPPFFANQQSSVIQQTPTKQTAISSIVPSSLTTQQSSALNVVDISSNMDEYSYVTHESNVKALDSHVAHLAENQENLHVLLRLTDILKQGDKYEDLQAKFYFNEFEIQCYETILCQLHPKQDPRLQRKVIAETHKSILSADLNELKLILKGLENHPSLPPLDSFQTTDAISNPSTPNVPSHSASSGAVPEFKPSTKRKASFEEQHREKGAKIVQSQERASNTTDNQPSVGKDSTSNIHASIPEVEVKFEFESNKFPNNSATVQTHVRSSSNSLTRIPEKSTTPPVIAPPDTTKSHFYMHTVNKTQAAPHQPSIGRLATDQRRDPPDAAPQSLANSNAVGPISHSEQLYKIDSSKPSSSLQQHSVSDSTQISTSAVPAKASENELPAKPLQSSSNLDIIPDTNSNVDSQPVSTNRPPSPVPMNAVVSTELNTDRQEPTVALPAATSDKTYDTVRQELIIIREEAREQRARTDQLLTLLHNEAQQRHEAERRIAEMTVEIQDQQVKILRKDLEAKRSEALSMMYKAQAEMREASAIASEAREQRAKAMEDSARAQVEIQSLQRRIQEMEFRYHGSSKNSGNNNFMSEGAMTNVDKYGTLSAISSETLSLRQGTTHLANDLISTSSAVTTLNSSNVRSAVITAAKMELTSAVTAASITTHKEMTLDSVSSGKEDCAADVLPVVSASE